MERKRVADEVIEILCKHLHRLPLPHDEEEFDYELQPLRPEITNNDLDIAEVSMDLEDAFGVSFGEDLPGSDTLTTIGQVIDFITERLKAIEAGSAEG
jgi:hypothetical protein